MGLIEDLVGAGVPIEGFGKLDPKAGIVTEGIVAMDDSEGAKSSNNLTVMKDAENKSQQG